MSKRAHALATKLENLEDDCINLYIQFGERSVWPIYKALRGHGNTLGALIEPALVFGNKIKYLGPLLRFLQQTVYFAETEYEDFEDLERKIHAVCKAANDELNVSDLMI